MLVAGTAAAQGYPSKPVRVIVPYPAGGIVDIVARAVMEKIAAGWGQPIIIEDKPGADSNIGTDLVAKSAPDGYTWLVTGPAVLSNPTIYGNLSWDPLRDFQGVGIVVWNQNIAVVPAALPVNTMKEFVEYAKARPGQLNFGNPGTGSSNHLSTELFIQVAGIKMVNVGYKGQPPAIPDLLNGALHFKIVALGLALPHVPERKVEGARHVHARAREGPARRADHRRGRLSRSGTGSLVRCVPACRNTEGHRRARQCRDQQGAAIARSRRPPAEIRQPARPGTERRRNPGADALGLRALEQGGTGSGNQSAMMKQS